MPPDPKLSAAEIRWAKKEYMAGRGTIRELAGKLGVSYSTLQRVFAAASDVEVAPRGAQWRTYGKAMPPKTTAGSPGNPARDHS